MDKMYFINKQNQIETALGYCLNRPAIYFDYKADTLLKIGEFEKLSEIMTYESHVYASINKENNVAIIELTNLPVEMAYYVIYRALMYSASGFIPRFYHEMTTQPNDIKNWIQSEMNRVQIDLYNK